MATPVNSLLSDPDFQKLSPVAQRQAVRGVGGDDFAKLSDEGVDKFVSGMKPDQNPQLPGATPRLISAVKSGQALGTQTQPTGFEKTNAMSPVKRELNSLATGIASTASGLPEATDLPKAMWGGPNKTVQRAEDVLSPLPPVPSAPSNPNEDPQDAAERRAHEIGTVGGAFLPSAIDGAINMSRGAVTQAVGKAVVDPTGRPNPVPRLILGNDRAQALGEFLNPDIAAQRVAAKAKIDALAEGRTAPGPWRPGIKPTPELGSVDNPGMFSKIPTSMPKPQFVPLSQSPNAVINAERALTGQVTPLNESPYYNNYKAAATDREAVPVNQSPYYNQTKARLAGGGGLVPPDAPPMPFPPVPSNGNGFHGNPTPFPGPANGSALTLPGEPVKVGSEGRPATWRNTDVDRLASSGNRDAITQTILRGKTLPTNARYVMGDPDTPRVLYNPREVTRFTPDGIPIRNSANPMIVNSTGSPVSSTPSPVLPPVPQSVVGTPAAYGLNAPLPPPAGPSASLQNFHDVPSQPVSPQEVADLSRVLGRPISAAEVPGILRAQAAEQNIHTGLAGNRADAAGNIRELHRAKLEKPSVR